MKEETRLDESGSLIPKVKCPVCDYEPDAASAVDGSNHRPKPGDLTLCLKCGEIMQFGEKMRLESASIDNLLTLRKESPKQWQMMVRAQKLIRRDRPLG